MIFVRMRMRPSSSTREISMKLTKRPPLRWKLRSQSVGSTVKRTTAASSGSIRRRRRDANMIRRKRKNSSMRGEE